ncbi:Adenine DNA glycosylase (modular protein) [uncultured Defluviicoccus sp.]|uniref:Adenine DNA glycosylase n=1 Tax=metagenome TaxID=256318 RepID=A0A380T7Q2_9ZZZZ|nr:Adenine DNA glycosylase (modular protein) [uncultured Defluviicoccus sp.]
MFGENRAPQGKKGGLQVGIADAGEIGRERCGHARSEQRLCWWSQMGLSGPPADRQRGMDHLHARNCRKAENRVDSLDDPRLEVLQLGCQCAGGEAKMQRSARLPAARIADPLRHHVRRKALADDGFPPAHDRFAHESALADDWPGQDGDGFGERAEAASALGWFHAHSNPILSVRHSPDNRTPHLMTPDATELSARLLAWYDRERRELPWRAPPGVAADPYAVWISEVMLQQTTVAAVTPYFQAFLARWPRLQDLAAADLDEVLHAWQGLGYYSRARNLHACARLLVAEHEGRFPAAEDDLRALPGIGAYTAAAIAAIAFGQQAAPVDGNVIRVIARLYALDEPLPRARQRIESLAKALTPAQRPGDFAQALMDLGATVCRPRQPNCPTCPWRHVCAARAQGHAEAFPVRPPATVKPLRRGVAFWLVRAEGAVLLRRRPERGLLGGMIEVPSTPWRAEPWPLAETLALAPVAGVSWQAVPGLVRHTFTHFTLELAVIAARVGMTAAAAGIWTRPQDFAAQALPSVMKKVVRLAQAGPVSGRK